MYCNTIGQTRRKFAHGIARIALLLMLCIGVHPAAAMDAQLEQGAATQRSTAIVQSAANVAVVGAVRSMPAGGLALGRGAPEFMHEKFGFCRWIDARDATDSLFVPDKDAEGWMSFINATQRQGVDIDPCSCSATPSTLAASNGQIAPVIIASGYASGDGRPNASSAYYQGSASASFSMGDACTNWTETVTATYHCTIGGWVQDSIARASSAATQTCCVDSTWSGPSAASICQGDTGTQISNCGTTREIAGSKFCRCTDTSWSGDSAAVICRGETGTQTSNCGNTRDVYGTKNCDVCTDTSWSGPSPASICQGDTGVQTSNCGNERTVFGSKNCNICTDTSWSGPSPASICQGDTGVQTSNCGNERTVFGSKNCNICTDTSWSGPSPSTACIGEVVEQTSNCGNSRLLSGTRDCWGLINRDTCAGRPGVCGIAR